MTDRFDSIVLCYHAVSDDWDHLLSVSPRALERQLRLMLARRYRPASATDVTAGRRRLLHVTFDDAYRSVWNAVRVLDRLAIRATVFVCTDYAEDGRTFGAKLYETIRDEELEALGGRGSGRLGEAADLMDDLVLGEDFPEFLTLLAYPLLDAPESLNR